MNETRRIAQRAPHAPDYPYSSEFLRGETGYLHFVRGLLYLAGCIPGVVKQRPNASVGSHRGGVGFGADGVYSPPTAMMLAIVPTMEHSMSPALRSPGAHGGLSGFASAHGIALPVLFPTDV
jgi:hypothetical protein